MKELEKFDMQKLRSLIGQRLRQARRDAGLTQEQFSELVGENGKFTISKYERGYRSIPRKKIEKFAEVLHVSPVYLLGYDDDNPPMPSNTVPLHKEFKKGCLVGDIACGKPINQEECIETLIPYDADIALYCKGDSMINAGINDGDIVFIKYFDAFDEMLNGRIVAVGIGDDYEYTLKRWFYNEEKQTVKLVPENDQYRPMIFKGEELEDIHLLGVAVGFTSVL